MREGDENELHVVTGAFGYTGKYIAQRLIASGVRVRTLTNSTKRNNPFGGQIEVRPFQWHDPDALASSLAGATVLYNTYWVRFKYKSWWHPEKFDFSVAVQNSLKLFDAAKRAGVKRIVHVSITNPSRESELEYFKGKAVTEEALINSGISYAILRPAVFFGHEDILLNNIAWTLRKFPVVGVFGDGSYSLQPIYIEDFADLAVEFASAAKGNVIINATGPETFSYRELLSVVGDITGHRRRIISLPPFVGYLTGWLIGCVVDDVVITYDEIKGLMENRLHVPAAAPVGRTKLTDWLRGHRKTLGGTYARELARRANRQDGYEILTFKGFPDIKRRIGAFVKGVFELVNFALFLAAHVVFLAPFVPLYAFLWAGDKIAALCAIHLSRPNSGAAGKP